MASAGGQDLPDDIVWAEPGRLLEDPALVQAEIDRHLEAARDSDPNQQREADLRHRLIKVRKGIDRLVTAYQEELLTLDDVERRDRSPGRVPPARTGAVSRTALRCQSCQG